MLMLVPASGWAEDFYVSAVQQGDGSGGSCATAHDDSWFVTSVCGSGDGKVSGGDTVYFCDDGGDYTTTMSIGFACNGSNGLPIYLKNAPGEIPVFNVVTGDALSFANANKHDFVIDGITFAGWENNQQAIFVNSGGYRFEIKNCNFTRSNATSGTSNMGIYFYQDNSTTQDSSGINIHDNFFSLDGWTNAIQTTVQVTTAPYKYTDLTIANNTIENVRNGIFMFLGSSAVAAYLNTNGLRPNNLLFTGNRITNTKNDAFATQAGVQGTSRIADNIVVDCGDNTAGNVNNCFQVHWADGLVIEDNSINGVETDTCDGCGIIIDYTDTDDAYLSTNVIIRRNLIKNIVTSGRCTGSGIDLYKATNTSVYNNIIDTFNMRCLVHSSNESSGNVFYNNTCYNGLSPTHGASCFRISDNDNIGAGASTWKNNICSTVDGYGWHLNNNSTAPTETNNLIYGAYGADVGVTRAASTITADPQFRDPSNGIFTLLPTSPAINAGAGIPGIHNQATPATDLAGNPILTVPDIGAYEYPGGLYFKGD
jgi:hypothetical protein